jgi:hypothetical protein
MGSSPKKIVKKVKKVASSPIGQLALSVYLGNAPFMAGIGGSGLAGSAIRAGLTSGLVGVASGRGIDPKRMLTAGATAGLFKGVGNLQADRNFFDSGISNTGGVSSALDPGKVKGVDTFAEEQFNPIAEQVNITPSAAPTSFRETFGDINLERGVSEFGESRIMPETGLEEFAAIDGGISPTTPITPTTTSAIEDLDAQTYNIPGYTRQFGTSESLPDALASVGENIDTSQLSNLVKTTDGKIDFLQTGYLKQIGSDLMKGNFADAADLSLQVVKDNPFETITAITAAAPLFFSPVPQEGESEEDFAQRKIDVTNYLRQYGSNFYSGKDLDDFISRTTSNLGYAQGGRVEVMGGGIMGLGKIPMGTPRMNEGGVTELDYRAEGGFVPVGIKEKADDVPAMLSKNEFVMTADAVRSAGNGSIEKGAQKMYDTMKQLESRVV